MCDTYLYTEHWQGMVFIDRDGKQFRYILNWLRDGDLPILTDVEIQQLQQEAKYFQLQVK